MLLDIGLPDIDRWEVARKLREQLEPVQPALVAITGSSSNEDRRRSASAGIDVHLAKPAFR